MGFKKLVIFCIVLVIGMMGFVGCSCNEEETADEKYLRLYDINQNQEIDDWEKPFNYGEYNGVSYTGRQFVDSNGNVINSEDIHYIDSTNDFGQFFTNKEIEVVDEEDPTKKHKETIVVPNVANNVFMFRNGTYFDRSQDVISASVGARAYIVEISRLEELEKFAKMNLTNTDNDKYILSLTSDISFRTGESNGNPLAVFSSPKLINLNGASIYGNGKTIEGFVLNPNNDAFLYKPNQTIKSEKGEYDDKVSTVNLKYSLISNATAVYDLNIHVGYNNIVIEPTTGTETAQYNMYIDVAPLRNAVVVDNVMVRGKIDITTKVTKTSIGVDNSNITVAGVNVSMLCISEDLTARNNKIYVGEDVTKVTQFVPYDMREDERYSDIAEEDRHYDYDRLIMTQRVLQNQEDGTAYPEKEAYKHYEDKYVYYNTLRDNLSVTNCNVEGYIDYQEYSKESSSSSGNIVYTYNDSAFAVNIGGIYANPFDAYYLTKNCNSDIDVNLKTGASCNIGGIASYLYIGAFVENCTSDINVNLQPISNINTTIKNTNNIGGIAGGVVFNSEVKNCESKMSFDSSVLENEALVATNNLAVGGVVGVNHGLVVSCKTVIEKMSAVNYDIVTMGGIAGSSYGGVFVKNIAKVGVMLEEATQAGIIIKDATHSYTGAVVGSIIGGTISSCIVDCATNIEGESKEGDADYVSVGENKKLPQAYRVNAGLLFFQSRHFMTSSQAISLENSAKLYGTTPQAVVVSISEDNAFYDGEMILGNEYSPKCYKNLVIEKTDINFTCPVEESEDNKTEKDDEIEDNKQILLGKYVNIGGYYSYKFISSVYPYETLGADNNLRVYDSSFKINGSKEIFYEDTTVTEVANPDGEGTKTETKVTRKSINFFDTSNISHFSFVTKLSLEDLFRRQLGHNGVSKTGVNELEDIGQQEVLLIENLKINNIYSGKYLSPDNFTQLQLDIDYYADLEVDTYDEFEFLLDIYMNKDSSSDNIYNTTLHRKDLFDVFMFKSNMFETDYSYIMSKHLVLDTDDESGYRYKRDKGTGDVIYTTRAVDALSSPDQQVETILDQLYFGTRTINGIKILYAFKKESLTATEDKNGVIIYHLPDGFDAIDQDNQAVVDRLLPIEIMLLYRLTQIRGVGYVEVNYNINDVNGVSKVENDFVLSKLMVTIYYSNVNRIDTYVLDTYNMGMLMENISTFYLVKSQQQASEGI